MEKKLDVTYIIYEILRKYENTENCSRKFKRELIKDLVQTYMYSNNLIDEVDDCVDENMEYYINFIYKNLNTRNKEHDVVKTFKEKLFKEEILEKYRGQYTDIKKLSYDNQTIYVGNNKQILNDLVEKDGRVLNMSSFEFDLFMEILSRAKFEEVRDYNELDHQRVINKLTSNKLSDTEEVNSLVKHYKNFNQTCEDDKKINEVVLYELEDAVISSYKNIYSDDKLVLSDIAQTVGSFIKVDNEYYLDIANDEEVDLYLMKEEELLRNKTLTIGGRK